MGDAGCDVLSRHRAGIDLPARLAYVPGLVDKEDSPCGRIELLLFNVARAIGPGLAGASQYCWGRFVLHRQCGSVTWRSSSPLPDSHSLPPRWATLPTPAGVSASWPHGRCSRCYSWRGSSRHRWLAAIALLPSFADNVLGLGQKACRTLLSSVGFGALCAALTAASIGNEFVAKS